jgi:predicted anti-sigma-YlaC factor YlaD
MDGNSYTEQHEEQFSLCARVRERLPDLIEGYLDAMTAEAIRAHLSVCYLCSRVFDEMERTIKLVETLPFVDPRRDFGPSVLAAIQKQQKPQSPLTRALRRLRPKQQ